MKKQDQELTKLWADITWTVTKIAQHLGVDNRTVQRRARKLGLGQKQVGKFVATQTKETVEVQFLKFLATARTFKVIQKRFGAKAAGLIRNVPEGYVMFKPRSQWGEKLFVLIPKLQEDVKIQEKNWSYKVGSGDNGEEQPYLVVQLPDFKGKIRIAPLFDVHYGNLGHRHEKFLAYIRWIRDTPNVYAVLGGDLMENALDDGRGMTYDQTENPDTQFNDMIKFLSPIAHKILVAVPGNHENRTSKKAGFDITAALAKILKVPYFEGPVFMSVLANTYHWLFYVHHGTGNSQTRGGRMNMAARPKSFTGMVHFFLSGHVHDCLAEPETIMIEDPIHMRLIHAKQWVVVAQSFLGWYKTYAYRAEFKPPAAGGVSIVLSDDGGYKASLTE